MEEVIDLKIIAEEFLDIGIEVESLAGWNKEASELCRKWTSLKQSNNDFTNSIDATVRSAVDQRDKLTKVDVLDKFNKLITLQTELSFIRVRKCVENLQRIESVSMIPSILLELYESIPKPLSGDTKISKIIIETLSKLRRELLVTFNEKFEKYIGGVVTNEKQKDEDDKPMVGSLSKFNQFLSNAKVLLLAYILVCLFPHTLNDTSTLMLIEKYKDAIDTVLTPLWGKFHFHLTSARSSHITEQIIWTFKYCQTYVQLLVDLTEQLTSSSELQQLYQANYHTAGLALITDKTVRFMRAHVAQILSDNNNSATTQRLALVESVLELDDFLQTIYPPQTYVIEVICDARPWLQYWLMADQKFFQTLVMQACDPLEAYTCPFSSPMRCYSCVYDCLSLFLTACKRYAYASRPAQEMFVELILEPLLHICLGSVLLRIRTSPQLVDLGNKILPLSGSRPEDLCIVIESVQYVTECFRSCSADVSINTIRSRKGRLESNWKTSRLWIKNDPDRARSKEALQLFSERVYRGSSITGESWELSIDNGTISDALQFVSIQMNALTQALEQQYVEAKRN